MDEILSMPGAMRVTSTWQSAEKCSRKVFAQSAREVRESSPKIAHFGTPTVGSSRTHLGNKLEISHTPIEL